VLKSRRALSDVVVMLHSYLSLGLLSPNNPLLLFGLFAFYDLFLAATEGVEKAFVADLAPTDLRGTAYGWFNLASGIVLLPASLIFGWLYEHFGAMTAFGFSAGCAGLAIGLLLRVKIPRSS
jgi:MFS family permease